MRSPLYTDIIQALTEAEKLGAFTVAHRGETVSKREAVRQYGSWAVTEYERQFGVPTRTGQAANSKKTYLVTRLQAIVKGLGIERLVVGFEQKVRKHQRQLNNI